jgi:ribokinase
VTGGVVVAGQLARDLVLQVDQMPDEGTAADVRLRLEMLGGKGANQAVSLAQLGAPVSLVAVAGGDEAGDRLVAQAALDGIDVSGVVRRAGCPTALIVEALDADGGWRYLQHLPPEMLLTPDDVAGAAGLFGGAAAVLVQLQQPSAAALAAARCGRGVAALVVLDGVPAEEDRSALLALADVLRTDERETELLTGGCAGRRRGRRRRGREGARKRSRPARARTGRRKPVRLARPALGRGQHVPAAGR